ncbi:MAG: RNA-binding protein, partial [Saprospiraceae bacterium]
MNIFVAKLDLRTESSELQSAFEQFGEVSSAKVIMDKLTGKSKGFGFVEMPISDEALKAIDALNNSELAGSTILVKVAEDRSNDRRGGGGSGYDRGGGGYNRGG